MADAIAELRREVHKRGYDTKKTEGNHWTVFDSNGEVVRTRKGMPLEIVASNDRRSMNNNISNLRDAGVLPRPKEVKPTQRPTKLKKEQLTKYVNALREELKILMQANNLTQADIHHYAWYYNNQHPPLLLSSEASAQTTVSRFLKGGGLSNNGYTFLSAAVSAMKTLNGDIPRAAEIRTRLTASAPQPEERAPKEIEVEGESTVNVTRLPDLAFEVMQTIYRKDKDHDAIMALVERIAKLELGA